MTQRPFTKRDADERRRRSNEEQWAKPLSKPVEYRSSVDMGRGQEP
jgi:hypothetical protein